MTPFKKAVVWGCPLHQHTNSYVYAAFHKAFKHMGFDAYWLDENSDVSGMDFSETLFVTEWQHAKGMPKRKDCRYVLHNCDPKDYDGLDVLHLQTYTDPCVAGTCVHNQEGGHLAHPGIPEKVNNEGSWFLCTPSRKTLFQPWATDLLPEEIDLSWADRPRQREIHWVGTIGAGLYGNVNEINGFRKACEENGIPFVHHAPGSVGFEEGRELVQRSFLSPAIHGTEQCRVGYIACRVFKNISYGCVGATNCRAANELFEGELVFNPDTYALFHDMQRTGATRDLMSIVRDRHTYVNRIKTILKFV